jgi:hypothetical protein
MDVYMYQAALLCEDCTRGVRSDLKSAAESDSRKLDKEDSDNWPVGPYPGGGGEADVPQHCDICDVFLENPLTPEGYLYVIEKLCLAEVTDEVEDTWSAHYDIPTEGYLWDRFDICEAYYLALYECHSGAGSYSYARASTWHHRLKFKPRPSLSVDTLSENGLGIYISACRRFMSKGYSHGVSK